MFNLFNCEEMLLEELYSFIIIWNRLTILDKIFGTKSGIKQNWTWLKKLIPAFETFSRMSPPKIEIFLIFLNFLRSQALSCLVNWALLYLWWIEAVLKSCKVPKYYEQDYLQILLLLSALSIMIQNSEKKTCFGWKKGFMKKLPLSKNAFMLKAFYSQLWPEPNMSNSAYTKPLTV